MDTDGSKSLIMEASAKVFGTKTASVWFDVGMAQASGCAEVRGLWQVNLKLFGWTYKKRLCLS